MLRSVEDHGPASVTDLVEATGLHENTVRGHLDRLCADGYVRSESSRPAGRGRPSLRWIAVHAEARNPYAGLAIALAETLSAASPNATALMRAAGVAWGTSLAERSNEPAGTEASLDETRKLIFEVMRDQGFSPEPSKGETGEAGENGENGEAGKPGETAPELLLRSCPILEAAKGAPHIVCAAHTGMIEGLVRSRGSEGRLTIDLEPFAAPHACALRLRAAS